METTLLAALIAGMGGIITYLLTEVRRLRRDSWMKDQALYQNAEAMKDYAAMRKQGGPPE